MAGETADNLESLPADFPLFALEPFLVSTKGQTAHDRYRLIALVLVHFLQDHKLTTRIILPPNEAMANCSVIRVADLTQEGLRFYCSVEQKWLCAIDGGNSPTDTTLLVKALRTV